MIIFIVAEREEKREKRANEENDGREKEEGREKERRDERERREPPFPSLLPVCRFKTSPCVPGKRPHVLNMRAFSRYTRRRPERTHGGVLNLHTEGFFRMPSRTTPHKATQHHTTHYQQNTQHHNTTYTPQHTSHAHNRVNTHTTHTHTHTHT